jgi:hypothetical protein
MNDTNVRLVAADDGLASPPPRVAAREVQRRVFPWVEQVGDQAEQLGGLLVPAVLGHRVDGVLDDPHGQRRAVLLAARRQFREIRCRPPGLSPASG